jgi:hypothetical protein
LNGIEWNGMKVARWEIVSSRAPNRFRNQLQLIDVSIDLINTSGTVVRDNDDEDEEDEEDYEMRRKSNRR